MKNSLKKIYILLIFGFLITTFSGLSALAVEPEETSLNYIKAVIKAEEAVEIQKSTIFDASQSFIADTEQEVIYDWDFGDGNRNEGVEVLHTYKKPGNYVVTLTVSNKDNEDQTTFNVFAYKKLIVLLTDMDEGKDRLEVITKNYAEKQGVFLKIIESFGASTEFISEEILTKKLIEESSILQKSEQIVIFTKENSGLNALSRYLQNTTTELSNKSLIVLLDNISGNINRIQRQFSVINPQNIILVQEGALSELIDSETIENFIKTLQDRGYEYELITSKTGKIMPWNFMSYFVDYLINQGIPDNTIALLLLLPVIATVVAFMKQIVGITTFGIYTPSIITLSFLVIGIHIGLITLAIAILIGSFMKPSLKKVRILFVPKMAIVMTAISLILLLLLIASNYLGLFDATFLSIAIFPMLILSTLAEKFVSVRTERGLGQAVALMAETIFVAIVAFLLVGGELDLGIFVIKFEYLKRMLLSYPEIIFIFVAIDIILGRFSGLRILERIRFREIFRHIEE